MRSNGLQWMSAGVVLVGFLMACTAKPPVYGGGDDDSGGDDDGATATPPTSPVIFTEIMANPKRVSDTDGEWFELYNTGTSKVDLDGWTVTDASGEFIAIKGIFISPRGYAVLGPNDKTSGDEYNGGVSLTFKYEDLTIGNTDESLTLADSTGAVQDTVSFTKAPEGASLSLDPKRYDASQNDDETNFCASKYSTLEDGDLGTPGSTNDVCFVTGSPGDLVITEIMANPASVDDSWGEWIEIYNTTTSTIKLDGWVVEDPAGDKHTIAANGKLEIKARSFLVLGNHPEQTENGGVKEDYSWKNEILLDDTGGTIKLIAGNTEVDVVAYGESDFPPTPEGASLQLDSSAIGSSDGATKNDEGANWCVSTTLLSGGDAGTPDSTNVPCGS